MTRFVLLPILKLFSVNRVMDKSSRDFEEAMIEAKKAVVIDCLKRVAKIAKVKPPSVKFWDGECPNCIKDNLAHYHPEKKQVCFSRRRLQQLNLDELEDTTIHEFTHMFHLNHGPKFYETHGNLSEASWIEEHEKRRNATRVAGTVKRKGMCFHAICKNKATHICEGCKRSFCEVHIRDKPMGLPKFSSNRPEDLTFMYEWRKPGGHGCPKYSDKLKRENISRERERLEENRRIYLEALERQEKSEKEAETNRKMNQCNYHLCDSSTPTKTCEFCGRKFCDKHANPKPPRMPRFRGKSAEDRAYMDEWRKPDGHPCVQYVKMGGMLRKYFEPPLDDLEALELRQREKWNTKREKNTIVSLLKRLIVRRKRKQ